MTCSCWRFKTSTKTGVFYYRSKNPEGGFQNPPSAQSKTAFATSNEYINLYNHYSKAIRDATGINEVMDASTPKGDALVGVTTGPCRRQQRTVRHHQRKHGFVPPGLRGHCKGLQVIPTTQFYRVYKKL